MKTFLTTVTVVVAIAGSAQAQSQEKQKVTRSKIEIAATARYLKKNLKVPMLQGGGQEGNGGDDCENRIMIIRDDIKDWIIRNGADNLDLYKVGTTVSQYKEKMLAKLTSGKISCTSDKIVIYDVEKTCKNLPTADHIVCNANRFAETTQSSLTCRA